MTMVDENDPFKGLETKTKKKRKPIRFERVLDHMFFGLMVVLTVVSGIQGYEDRMRFGVLILFLMLILDYLRDVRREQKASAAERKIIMELLLVKSEENSVMNQFWKNIPSRTVDLASGKEPDNDNS